MRKHRGFTLAAVFTLAFGIGANTALFSIVDAMLLKLLPVKEPERLVLFQSYAPREFRPGGYSGASKTDPATGQERRTSFPYVSYQRMREQQPSALSDIFAFSRLNVNLVADGKADVANGHLVTGNYYAALGLQAALGRLLAQDDDKASAEPVAVLGYRYWQRFFGGEASVVGQQIHLNNRVFTVVGVTPPGFEGAGQVGFTEQVTIPLAMEPLLYDDPKQSQLYVGRQWFLRVMGRLKPGATQAQAQAQLETAFQQSVVEHRAARSSQSLVRGGDEISPLDPKEYPRLALTSGSQGEMDYRERYAPSLYLLFGVAGLVLLIACANVANLLLARASSRQKEIGLRLALGASRRRLIQQLLTESVLLAGVSGALGLMFALWIKDGLLAVSEWGPRALEPKLDWRVLGFTLGLSLLTGIVFGLAPAWRATKVDLTPTLKDSGRNTSAAARSLLSRGLVVMQVAVSLLLLVGAGLFVRTLLNLQRVDPGFNTQNLLLFRVSPGLIGYKEERLIQLYERISERLEEIPGVQKVTFSAITLLAQNEGEGDVYIRSATEAPEAGGRINATGSSFINHVRENFLEAMEIPLLAGRTLSAQDDTRAPEVVVINQAFAKKFFPNENPIGKRIGFDQKKPDEIEVVGLAKDAKYGSQRAAIPPTVYIPWRQQPGALSADATVEVRTAGDPNNAIAAVRQAMREVDEALPLRSIKTQVQQADETLRMERLFAKLVTLFGLLAQQLASIGLFGVLAYGVSQRTHEIGIRMAIGASRSDVLTMIVKQGMGLSVIGIVLGLAGAYVLTKYLEGWMRLSQMLYGIKPTDPVTYGVTAVLLTVVALIACYIPARRAAKVEPMIALRCE
jgi:predicted permease